MAFLAVYASRLGASGFQIGLLMAGPAVANLMFSLPAGRWLEGSHLIRVSFLTSILHRCGYLLLIPLPIFFDQAEQVWMILLIAIGMSIPGTVLAIGFNAMFADVIPPDLRSEVVGKRNALVAISITLTSLVCGQVLDRIMFPINYQVVFGLGGLGAMLSSYHLGKIRSLGVAFPRLNQPIDEFARPGVLRFVDALRRPVGLRFLTRSGKKSLVRPDLLRGPFGLFLISFLLFYTFQYLPIPLFPLFFVYDLNLSDGAISLGNAIFYLAMLLASLRLNNISARLGHRGVMIYGTLLYSLYPLLNGLARDVSLYWIASLLGGGVWAMTNGGLVNRLMERVPENDRPAHMALHNLALNLGILSGSLFGPFIGELVGLRAAILLSAALRLLAGLVLGVWG